MTDNEKVQQIEKIVEELISQHHWADEEVQTALLEIARNHMWKKGLWARMRYVINIVGFIGVIAGTVITIMAIFGYNVSVKL